MYAEYTDTPVHDFAGVTLEDLSKIEAKFDVNVVVYKLDEIADGKTTAELVRRSTGCGKTTMYVNLHENHYSYIRDVNMYSRSWRCCNCEQALWKSSRELHRHERTCEVGVNRMYTGGVYRPPPSIFERLDDEGIVVEKTLRYYPYRATFDFECYFTGDNVPTDTDHVRWVARHVPLSVSVASNVPGYEPAQCYITDGDSDKLVADMIDHLTAISDAAYESLLPSYEYVLDELKARNKAWDEEEEEESETNPYEKLVQQLCTWLHQLPAIGFNSGHYDRNVVKKFFIPYMLKGDDKTRFVIKRQNTFMCKYLKAYGCELQKGHFQYEYMDGVGKLDDCVLPPQAAFYSQLKNEDISDADYARRQAVWHDNGMTTLRDFLVWYNNRDALPRCHRKTSRLLQTAEHRYVQGRNKRPRPLAAPPLQRPTHTQTSSFSTEPTAICTNL